MGRFYLFISPVFYAKLKTISISHCAIRKLVGAVDHLKDILFIQGPGNPLINTIRKCSQHSTLEERVLLTRLWSCLSESFDSILEPLPGISHKSLLLSHVLFRHNCGLWGGKNKETSVLGIPGHIICAFRAKGNELCETHTIQENNLLSSMAHC